MHRLSLIERDLDDLSGDLTADNDIVVRDDCSDAAQINRHVALVYRSGDDGNRGRWNSGLLCFGSGAQVLAGQCNAACCDQRGNDND
ncbi:MAG: hypothetical protein WAN27_13670 [Xanthobacteraceae bacterium]